MKSFLSGFIIFLLQSVFLANAAETELEGTVTISGAWAIYPTVVAWGEAFQALYPNVKIDVTAGGAGKGASDVIAGLTDIGMVSRDPDISEINRGITAIYILHDAVFPVVSKKNPALSDVLKKGIKRGSWTDIYVNGTINTWDEILKTSIGKKIHIYTRSDSCGAASAWAKYTGNKKQEDLKGVGIYGDPGLLEAVKRDPLGLGYNNFSFIFTREGKILEGVAIAPIDSNENGVADDDEIINNREKAIAAIRSAKYPASRKNYFFVKGKPSGLIKVFINFALSVEGTKIVDEVGTSLSLSVADRENSLKIIE